MNKFAFSSFAILLAGAVAAKPSFVLPERLYALPGRECNVYFSNVFGTVMPRAYAFEAKAQVGEAQAERWHWTPKTEDAGRKERLVLSAWTDDGLVSAATATVVVAGAARCKGRRTTVALFADSLTNSGYQDELFRVMRTDGFSGYTPVGSRKPMQPGCVPHDGFGGYCCKAFLTYYNVTEDELARVQDAAEREQLAALGVPVKVVKEWQRELLKSPLIRLDGGRKIVDVPGWMRKANGGEPPDVVIVELGVNAVFGLEGSAEEMRREIRSRVIPEFEQFVAALRPHMPKAVIAITSCPLGCGQDGFGANYGATASVRQHRVTLFELNRALADYVRQQKDGPLALVPIAQAIDPVHGFLRAEMPANARTSEKVVRDRNALHPSTSGGAQLADAIASWLACHWDAFADGFPAETSELFKGINSKEE